MTENTQTEAKTPAVEALQDVAQTSDAKAQATSTAKASDELSEGDLETVSGGVKRLGSVQASDL